MPKPKSDGKDVSFGPLDAPATEQYSRKRPSIPMPVVEELLRSDNGICA